MSFDVEKFGGWSNEKDGSTFRYVATPLTGISGKKIYVATEILPQNAFEEGDEVLLHHSLCQESNLDCDNDADNAIIEKLGKFEIRKVTEVNGSCLTLDETPDLDTENFYIQAVRVCQLGNWYCCYKKSPHNWSYSGIDVPAAEPSSEIYIQRIPDPVINEQSDFYIANYYPNAFDANLKCGGILAVKCNRIWLDTGWINVKDKGIPASLAAKRPLTRQEKYGTLDNDPLAGEENSITKDRLLLNVGDGAAFIMTRFSQGHSQSGWTWTQAGKTIAEGTLFAVLGNPDYRGVEDCRGATDSPNKPTAQSYPEISSSNSDYHPVTYTNSEPSNIGAPTLFLINHSIKNLNRYRAASAGGKGLGRCYVVPGSESDAIRAADIFKGNHLPTGIIPFGDGSDGDCINPTTCVNSYAKITAAKSKIIQKSVVDDDGDEYFSYDLGNVEITLGEKIIGQTTFEVGTLVVVWDCYGSMYFSRIIAVNQDTITLDLDSVGCYIDTEDMYDFYDGEDCNGIVHIGDAVYYDNVYYGFYAENYQLIAIPQYKNLTLSEEYDKTPKWSNGLGGICAMAVKNNCDLRNGKLNVEGKGTGIEDIYAYRDNCQLYDYVPLGSGHGSVLLLAKNLTVNNETRIGATYDGGANYTGWHRRGETDNYNLDGAHIFLCTHRINGWNDHVLSTGGANSSGIGGAGAGCKAVNGGAAGAAFVYNNISN